MNQRRYEILCDILFFRWLATLFLWGLPALFGPKELFDFFGLSMPHDMLYIRLFGAVLMIISLVYWVTWQDPLNHLNHLKLAIFENGSATLILWGLIFAFDLTGWYIWTSSLLTAFFFIALFTTFPYQSKEHPPVRETTRR